MVTDNLDIPELVVTIAATGKEIEESSKVCTTVSFVLCQQNKFYLIGKIYFFKTKFCTLMSITLFVILFKDVVRLCAFKIDSNDRQANLT